uniref:Protein krueppel n=1 Tax=Anopheles atroparvus TaxID=41427 RepID=A0AAG5DH55_ANOAO
MCDDVSNVCRLCMDALDLNHTLEDSTTLKMVEDCLQLTFTIAPPFLSAGICDDCYYKIKDFYEYKENCRSMQDLLWQDIEDYEGMEFEEKPQEDAANGDVSKELENEEAIDDTVSEIKVPPVILNSSLLAPKNPSSRENSAAHDTIGKVDRINVSLYSGADNVIIINKKTYHECSLCNRSFNDPYRLQQHMIGHKKKRTYLCEYCPMSFPQNSSLQVHIRSHTKEKPFVCPHCGNAYGYYQLLKKHLHRYHAEESGGSFSAGKQTVK